MENKGEKTTVSCTICHGETDFLGQIPLRTEGSSGASKLFFGKWAELGEQMWPIDIYRCKKCGHLELFDLDQSLPKK